MEYEQLHATPIEEKQFAYFGTNGIGVKRA